MTNDDVELCDEAIGLAMEISRLLDGHEVAICDTALADAYAMVLATYPERMRQWALAKHVAMIEVLLPINLEMIESQEHEGAGHA